MPKMTLLYTGTIPAKTLTSIGRAIQPLIVELIDEKPITIAAVDWIAQQHPPGSIVASPVSIELETIGFKHRKLKLHSTALDTLKGKILGIFEEHGVFADFNPNDQLIWVKFQDPAGLHV